MLIWQGFGILALFAPPILSGLMHILLYQVFEMNPVFLYKGLDLASALGVFLGICAIWFGGRWLNQRPGRRLIDPESGEVVELKRRHALFWIPMQYWAFVWPLFGIAAVFLK